MARGGGEKERPVLVCRNVTVNGRRTSLRMEPLLWDSMKEICEREGMSLNQMCSAIDSRRGASNLTAAIRVFIVQYFRAAVSGTGLEDSGPGGSRVFRRALDETLPPYL